MRFGPTVRTGGGFTLIELTVGLAVGGLVIISIHRTVAAVSSAAHALAVDVASQDQAVNGRRWLRSVMGSIRSPTEREPFAGRAGELAFTAATRRGDGELAPERIRVMLTEVGLVAERSEEGVLVIADSVAAVAFDYLVTPGAAAVWVQDWISVATSPVAVRIRTLSKGAGKRVDTLLLVAKDRR